MKVHMLSAGGKTKWYYRQLIVELKWEKHEAITVLQTSKPNYVIP